jgi:hypothetical protein
MKKTLTLCLATGMLISGIQAAHSAPVPFFGAAFSFDPAPVQAATESFRNSLGSGQLEINWDNVPYSLSSPNPFPPTFYNPQGVVLSTPGTGFEVSTDAFNPFGILFDFGNIDPQYPFVFEPFSQERMFTPRGSTITDVNFFLPGTNTPALTTGFGAVFSDVNVQGSTSLEFFDASGASLGKFDAPAIIGEDENFSFIGVDFNEAIVSKVRITSGNLELGPGVLELDIFQDLVVMDNFIYGPLVEATVNPVPEPGTIVFILTSIVGLWGFSWIRRNRNSMVWR